MSTDSDDDGGGGELPDEQADALLDQLADRADERDDIDLRPGSKRKISRRGLLGAVGAAGVGALSLSSQTAEAQTGQWSNSTGQAGTQDQPFTEGWVQDLHSESIDAGSVSAGHVWLGQQSDTPTDSEIGSGNVALYAKDDGNIYTKPHSGSESQVGSGGGGAFTDDDGDGVYTLPNSGDGVAVASLGGAVAPNGTITNVSGNQYVADSLSAAPSPQQAGDILLVPASESGDGGGTAVPSSATHRWTFSEGSGSTVGDSIGSLDASYNVAPTWDSSYGTEGYHAEHNGTDTYADLGSTGQSELAHFVNSGEGAIGGWIEPVDNSSVKTILGADTDGLDRSVSVWVEPNMNLKAGIWDGNENTTQLEASTATDSANPEPFMFTADGSNLYLYYGRNATQVGSTGTSVSVSGDLTAPISIGAMNDGSYKDVFEGAIGDLWTADTEVTQSEFQSYIDGTEGYY